MKNTIPERRYYPNRIDELMRRPATEFKGPNDPDLDEVIRYIRYSQMKWEKVKRSEISEDEADPELWKIASEGRRVSKPKAFRRL